MASSPIILLVLCAGLLPATPRATAPGPLPEPVQSQVRRGSSSRLIRSTRQDLKSLQHEEKRLRTSRVSFDQERRSQIAQLLDRLTRSQSSDPDFPRELESTLLSLLGTALDQGDRKPEARERWDLLAQMVQDAMGQTLLPGALDRLREEVLMSERGGPSALRAAVARLLAEDRTARTTMALLASHRASSELLANTCLDSLVGRREEPVHALFMRELEPRGKTPLVDPRKLARAEQHFSVVPLAEDSPSAAKLADWIAGRLMSQSWRAACRAVALCRGLADEAVVPALIEALGLWQGRADSGVPVRRTMHEISEELKDRSGRNIGTDPRRWQVWWRGVQNGTVSRRASPSQGGAGTTTAGFFGIRPASDRIVFVIDNSGSMDAAFLGGTGTGTTSHTRYKEAIEQLEGCLKLLGPKTRFDLVLFSSGSKSWKKRLVPATNSYIQGAKAWLRNHAPSGGTGLRQGVKEALRMNTRGNLDLERLEADTVVILCDGGTDTGSAWVEPFLRDINSEARLLFHAVRIGGAGDGTLQALALGSGGRCVDVDG